MKNFEGAPSSKTPQNDTENYFSRDEKSFEINFDDKGPGDIEMLQDIYNAKKGTRKSIIEINPSKRIEINDDIAHFVDVVRDKYDYDRFRMQKILLFHVIAGSTIDNFQEIEAIDFPGGEIATFINSNLNLEEFEKRMQEKETQE